MNNLIQKNSLFAINKYLILDVLDYLSQDEKYRIHAEIRNKRLFLLQLPDQFLGIQQTIIYESINIISRMIQLRDGRLATAGHKDIKIWDIINPAKQPLKVLSGHTSHVQVVLQMKDNNLASASHDMTIKVWNLIDYTCIHTFIGHKHIVYVLLELDCGLLLSGSEDSTLKLWGNRKLLLTEVLYHHAQITSMIKLKDGRLASASCNMSHVNLWKISKKYDNFSKEYEFDCQEKDVCAMLELFDGNVVSSYRNKKIVVWSPLDFSILVRLQVETNSCWSLAQLQNGRLLAGSCDGFLVMLDMNTKEALYVLKEDEQYQSGIWCIVQLSDGRVVTASEIVRIWI